MECRIVRAKFQPTVSNTCLFLLYLSRAFAPPFTTSSASLKRNASNVTSIRVIRRSIAAGGLIRNLTNSAGKYTSSLYKVMLACHPRGINRHDSPPQPNQRVLALWQSRLLHIIAVQSYDAERRRPLLISRRHMRIDLRKVV